MARAVDFIKRHDQGKRLIDEARLSIWNAENGIHFGNAIERIQAQLLLTVKNKDQHVGKLQHYLMRETEKSDSGGTKKPSNKSEK
jgi:hypothetical protein